MMTDKEVEHINEIHQAAATIQQLAINMLTYHRVGHDWRRDLISHSERIAERARGLGRG